MGKLTVERKKSFLSSARKFKVILDGEVIGYVGNNGSETFDVAEGEHTIQSGISMISGMSKKLKINLTQGESLVVVKPNPVMWVILILAIIVGANLGVALSRGIFSLPALIILIVLIGLSTIFAVSIKQEK
jgi:hypothetical protein